MDVDIGTAREERIKIAKGEDSFVLNDCVGCYACEEYCPNQNHPFYLISERREQKGMLVSSRPVTDIWVKLFAQRGEYEVGEVKEKALSLCMMRELKEVATGKLFDGISESYIVGEEFFCQIAYLHFAKPSIIIDRLPKVIENIEKLGIKQLVCIHDECYCAYASFAPAYGIDVPFEPIHYLEYLYGRLLELKSEIRRLNIKAAYQRPCSSRLTPDKDHFVADIFDLIGVEMVDREYQGENALCCGEPLRMGDFYEVANDVQKRNIDDMVKNEADYCIFNCPFCQFSLAEKVFKLGITPMHIIDLCKMAIGEK
jgi:Fe-S oxidoreductase